MLELPERRNIRRYGGPRHCPPDERVRAQEQRKRRRVQRVLAGAVLLMLALAGFGAGLLSLWRDAEKARDVAEDAKKDAEGARDQLAGKEMDIGRQLLNSRNYAGAINRFKVVVTRYQRTRHVEEALLRLTEAYMALGIVDEAQTSAAVLGHNFPESRWYKDAYTLMQSKGLQPSENKGSWISRAFKLG